MQASWKARESGLPGSCRANRTGNWGHLRCCGALYYCSTLVPDWSPGRAAVCGDIQEFSNLLPWMEAQPCREIPEICLMGSAGRRVEAVILWHGVFANDHSRGGCVHFPSPLFSLLLLDLSETPFISLCVSVSVPGPWLSRDIDQVHSLILEEDPCLTEWKNKNFLVAL